MKREGTSMFERVSADGMNRFAKYIILLLVLDWYLTGINVVSDNSTTEYIRKQFHIEEVRYREDGHRAYLLHDRYEFTRWTSGVREFGFMRIEDVTYTDEAGNTLRFDFIKVAGVHIDLSDHAHNERVVSTVKRAYNEANE